MRPFTAPSCWLRSHIARCYPNRAAPSISQSLFLSDSTVSLSRASRKHNPAMAAPRIAAAVRRTDGAAWSPLSPSSPPRPAVQRIRDDQSQRRALATSSLPPFVIRGISVTGRQRYGVKINTPGQVHRKQVRRSPPLFHLTQSTHMCTHPQHIPSPLSHTYGSACRCASALRTAIRSLLRTWRSSFRKHRASTCTGTSLSTRRFAPPMSAWSVQFTALDQTKLITSASSAS